MRQRNECCSLWKQFKEEIVMHSNEGAGCHGGKFDRYAQVNAKMDEKLDKSASDTSSEPLVTSSNPQVRKLARQLRISRRLDNIRRIRGNNLSTDNVETKTPLAEQLVTSARVLTTLTTEGDEMVTNVRAANDSREVDRRESESIARLHVMEQLEAEAVLGQAMFEEIAGKWHEVLECNDPIRIHEDLAHQKEKCDELIKQKDALIETLKEEVRKAEIKFTTDQRKQNEDIKSLGQRIEKQVEIMRGAYKEQLKTIEDVIAAERQTLTDSDGQNWESFYKTGERQEVERIDKMLGQMGAFHADEDATRTAFQEKHRDFKIAMEGAIRDLQVIDARLKAGAVANKELLDYNYQVLRKKEDENLMVGARQKRRVDKLRRAVADLRKKIREHDAVTKSQIANLTEEARKLQARAVEMDSKAEGLSKVNDCKYAQIWKMNVEMVDAELQKVLSIDRILHEQLLGLEWQRPEAVGVLEERQRAILLVNVSEALRPVVAPKERLLKRISQLVADESDFLIDDKIREVLAPYREGQRDLVKIDNVFRALGLEKVEDVDFLLEFFNQYAICEVCQEGLSPKKVIQEVAKDGEGLELFPLLMQSVSQPESVIDRALGGLSVPREELGSEESTSSKELGGRACDFAHPLAINPLRVADALRDFVLSFNNRRSVGTLRPSVAKADDVEKFWMAYREVFSNEQLWDGMLFGLKRYHEILKDRKLLNEDVVALRKQNAELKHLLRSYTLSRGTS